MPYEVYKIIHLVGIMMLFLALGGAFFPAICQQNNIEKRQKRPWLILHGVGLLLTLIGGFGLLARLGIIKGFPGWVWAKLVIWVLMSGVIALIFRKRQFSKGLIVLVLILGGLGAWLAGMKPF